MAQRNNTCAVRSSQGRRRLGGPQASFKHWADAAATQADGRHVQTSAVSPGCGPRGGLAPGSYRRTTAAPARGQAPLSGRSPAGAARGSSTAMQLVAVKRAELEKAARELAKLEALAATRAAGGPAAAPQHPRTHNGGTDAHTVADAPGGDGAWQLGRSARAAEQHRIGKNAARPVLVDASGSGRPRLPLQLQPLDSYDLPEPPLSARRASSEPRCAGTLATHTHAACVGMHGTAASPLQNGTADINCTISSDSAYTANARALMDCARLRTIISCHGDVLRPFALVVRVQQTGDSLSPHVKRRLTRQLLERHSALHGYH